MTHAFIQQVKRAFQKKQANILKVRTKSIFSFFVVQDLGYT